MRNYFLALSILSFLIAAFLTLYLYVAQKSISLTLDVRKCRKNINVYKFHDNLAEDTDEKAIGFLAKEFYPKYMDIVDGVPGAVDEDGDPEYMSIFRENLIPHLFNAVKYLSAKIEEIEGRLENV